MSSMMIQNLFPSPIAVIDNEQSSSINASLKKLFLEREKNKEQYKNANPPPTVRKNIFDSEMNLFDDPQPDIQKLHHYIMNNLYQFIGELNGYSPSQLQKLRVRTNAWFHITRDGGYISTHNHPVSAWSGVYYVDAGREIESDKSDNGVLRFIDTRNANAYLDPANMNLKSPFGFGSVNFHPKPGRLILFPSYLQHEATPYEGAGTRICVAFNSVFRFIE